MTDDQLTAHLHVLQDLLLAVAAEVPPDRLDARIAVLAEASRLHMLNSTKPDATSEYYDDLLQMMLSSLRALRASEGRSSSS